MANRTGAKYISDGREVWCAGRRLARFVWAVTHPCRSPGFDSNLSASIQRSVHSCIVELHD